VSDDCRVSMSSSSITSFEVAVPSTTLSPGGPTSQVIQRASLIVTPHTHTSPTIEMTRMMCYFGTKLAEMGLIRC
jgi:hypothetical protein